MKAYTKSIFISALPVTALIFTLINAFAIYNHGFLYSKLGVIVIGMSIVLFFIALFAFYPARTSKKLPLVGFPILIGLILVLYGNIFIKPDLDSLTLAFILIIGWFMYIIWYSYFGDRLNVLLTVGRQFPEIKVENYLRETISSKSFLGTPTVYVFYRGNWCPLCIGQVNEIVKQYKELEIKNVQMVFISPQSHKNSKKLAEKFNLKFHFLTDVDNKVAKSLNIEDVNGIPFGFQILGYKNNTVLPTVIITNSNGRIIFADLTDNYRVRPEPQTFLKLIKK